MAVLIVHASFKKHLKNLIFWLGSVLAPPLLILVIVFLSLTLIFELETCKTLTNFENRKKNCFSVNTFYHYCLNMKQRKHFDVNMLYFFFMCMYLLKEPTFFLNLTISVHFEVILGFHNTTILLKSVFK